MREKFFRAQVWSPYFDDDTAWYPRGLASQSLYVIYRYRRSARGWCCATPGRTA